MDIQDLLLVIIGRASAQAASSVLLPRHELSYIQSNVSSKPRRITDAEMERELIIVWT